ncbi:MAG: class I SAM-dependent methyltransferase [Bacteriovorax sp.]|nr:class I SAM-dependent methyltransferase [Bacteriovorax sp.]
MICELIAYFNSYKTREARVFGHLYESIALIEREKRCRSYWLSHRTLCKNFITENMNKCSGKSSVLVLGSGPLHEIPLELLARSFEKVDLIDVVHLKSTKERYSQHKNVHFIEADITELESELLKSRKVVNKMPSQFLDQNYDLVISANILSQLSYHLRNFLEKKARPKLSAEELDLFANQVTFDHFLYLQKFSCPVILITDTETVLQDKQGRVIESETPYINFSFPVPIKEWWWNVAPIPEYQKNIALKMKVSAFVLNL